jgi:hypothetical protein
MAKCLCQSLDAEQMPWPNFSLFTDAEIHALWLYLQSLDALPTGGAAEAP